jgi:hypothetical protein
MLKSNPVPSQKETLMHPNYGKRVENGLIKNRGGFLRAPIQQLPWGDAVLLKKAFLVFPDGSRKHELFFPGVIFRPNRGLAKRTDNASTHIIYRDAYEAERGAEHAVRNYGLRTKAKGSESSDLAGDVSALREYVIFLLRMGPHLEHVLHDLSAGMNHLVGRYGWKIDESKRKANMQMIRGLIREDSLGRTNIPAQAMSMGGAIWNLLEREEAVQWLSMHMDQKALQTSRLIAAQIDLYQRLWSGFCPTAAIKQRTATMMHDAERQIYELSVFRGLFGNIVLLPFRKNASHTIRDIESAVKNIMDGNDSGYGEALFRLREGIRWVFVLDALQRGIIFPLSHLIADLLRRERVKRRYVAEKSRIIISSALAPERFADIGARIVEFGTKLAKCEDEVLAHPVKNEVLALLDVAKTHIAEDDWRLVKQDLDAIADIL